MSEERNLLETSESSAEEVTINVDEEEPLEEPKLVIDQDQEVPDLEADVRKHTNNDISEDDQSDEFKTSAESDQESEEDVVPLPDPVQEPRPTHRTARIIYPPGVITSEQAAKLIDELQRTRQIGAEAFLRAQRLEFQVNTLKCQEQEARVTRDAYKRKLLETNTKLKRTENNLYDLEHRLATANQVFAHMGVEKQRLEEKVMQLEDEIRRLRERAGEI